MRSPIIIKQSPLVLVRRIVEVEIIVSIFLFLASFLTNYEELYRTFTFGRVLRYDVFLFLTASILQLLITLIVFLLWHGEEYRVKDKEVIHRKGFLMSREQSVMLRNVASVEYKRSPIELLLGYGTIILWPNGGEKPFYIRSIDQAEIYTDLIKNAVDSALNKPLMQKKNILVLDLILEGEHSKLEFKETFRWDKKRGVSNKELEKAVMKSVAAFLNASGGILLIGVADNGKVAGLSEDINSLVRKDRDGFENHFNQVLKHMLGAEFRQYVSVSFETIEEKDVCIIEVEPSLKPVYLKMDGEEEFFIRTGNSTTPLKISEVNSYIDSHWKRGVV